MHQPRPIPPIVVGINGSDAAVQAAIWAADEARSRDLRFDWFT